MTKQPKVTSSFALLDIKLGRDELYKLCASGHEFPVTITGTIQPGTQAHGRDDGTSREFGMVVTEIHVGGPILGPPADKFGRLWALVDNVKAGDRIQLDGGFAHTECGLKAGATRTVKADAEGRLYFNCGDGKHYLAGQIGERGEYIGIYPT